MKKLVNAEITHETEKAYLIKVELEDGANQELFFPKSAINIEEAGRTEIPGIYAQSWIVEAKQEEIDAYITTEDV